MIAWRSSLALAALLLVPAAALFFWWAFRERERALATFVEAALLPTVVPDLDRRRRRIRAGLLVAVVAGNVASWRALEKAGLERVAEGDLTPDNPVDPPLHYVYRADRPAG